MAYFYGNTISSHWRAYGLYTTSSTNTSVTITLHGGFQSIGWGYDLSGVSCTVTNNGTGKSGSGSVSTGSGSTENVRLVSNNTVTISKGTSAKTVTLRTSINRSSASYHAGTSTGSTTVSIPALASYSVTYNANGGSGSTSAQTKYYGTALTLRSNGFTRTGYTFQKWNTKADGSGTSYSAGASYTGNAALTLYAIWKANTYTVSYNANGGSGAPSSQTKTYGVTLTLSSTKPTRTGYTFKGWATSSSATSATYAAGGSYTANAAAVLYAVWAINTYTVTYDANGGTGAPSAGTKTYGQSYTISTTIPVLSGYNFLGWSESSTATTATYTAGQTVADSTFGNAAKRLYAVWELAYDAPTITDLAVLRYDTSTSSDSDEGTAVHISFGWTVDSTDSGTLSSITVYRRERSDSDWQYSSTVAASGTSGTVDTVVTYYDGSSEVWDVATAYAVQIVVVDSHGTTTTKTTLLSPSFFTLDFLSGGHGISFFGAATSTGFSVGGQTAHLCFVTSDITTFTLPTEVSACLVLDTSDYGLYWYES